MNSTARLTLYIWIVLALASGGAVLLGRAQPTPQRIARLHLADCAPPCWIGIVPGVTSIAEAKARITATYGDLSIKDTASFPGGAASPAAVDNEIEGDRFYLFVRLTTSAPIDGRSETVEAITLVVSRGNPQDDVPTVGDILGSFGAPPGLWIDDVTSRRREVTLAYAGMDATFNMSAARNLYGETPRLSLRSERAADTPDSDYYPWVGLGTMTRGS